MVFKTIGGRYQIIRRLAGGGFGMTFLAEDKHLPSNYQCLVKQLKPQATNPRALKISRRLFDTEAKVLYKLGTHEQIPQLFAFFEENKEFYLVQEYIKGHSLSDELKLGKRWNEEKTIALLQEILEILVFVHQEKVIHRDVNPQNIIRQDENGQLFLIDFGAVKQITTQMMLATSGKTPVSVIIGTPGYMPSEQANGHPKLSSDVYSVGMIGIQALTGFPPDRLKKDSETAELIWQNKVSVSREFAEILNKMVRYDFRERYPSAVEALVALNSLQESEVVLPFYKTKTGLLNYIKNKQKYVNMKFLLFLVFLIYGAVTLYGAKFLYASKNASDYYDRGRTFAELNRYEDALLYYNKAIRIQENYIQAWNQKGNALYELKKYEKALQAYDKAIQINPENSQTSLNNWIGRGLVLQQLKRFNEALSSFAKAVQIEPKSHIAWQGQGDILFKLKRYKEAIEAYKKTVDLNKSSYNNWYKLGQCYHKMEEYKEARKAYEKAVEVQPDSAVAWYHLGNIWLQLEKYEEAVKAYDKTVRLEPHSAASWYSRGHALMKWEKPEEAIKSYEEALRLKGSKEDPELLYSLGWGLHELSRYEEAIARYDRVLDFRPEDYQAWYNRGHALFKLEEYEEAIASYEKAVAIKQDHYESWYSQGNVLMTLERYEEAIACYEKALLYKPDYKPAKEAKKQAEQALENLPSASKNNE